MLCSCHVITNTGKYAINSTFGRDKSFNVIPPENTCCYLDSGFKLEQQEIVLLCLATHFSYFVNPPSFLSHSPAVGVCEKRISFC